MGFKIGGGKRPSLALSVLAIASAINLITLTYKGGSRLPAWVQTTRFDVVFATLGTYRTH